MKILFSLDNFDHGEGGAEKSVQTISASLARAGHEVTVLQAGPEHVPYERSGSTIHSRRVGKPPLLHDREVLVYWQNRRWTEELNAFLDEHPADLIFTQHRLSPATVGVARARCVPVVTFVRAYGMFCATQFRDHDALDGCDQQCFRCLPFRQKIKYPLVCGAVRKLGKAICDSDVVLANSMYVQNVIDKFYGVRSYVLYPPVDLAAMRVERNSDADRVLFVKPQKVKGVDILRALASAMPDERFLVAGKLSTRSQRGFAGQSNVECMGWVDDMREAYRRSRVLVVPSLWPEPFGRVCVEAAASGIPSIASNAGGIPEAVGGGGILVDNRANVEQWKSAVQKLKDGSLYDSLSRKARDHARHFGADVLYHTLQDAVKESLGLEI